MRSPKAVLLCRPVCAKKCNDNAFVANGWYVGLCGNDNLVCHWAWDFRGGSRISLHEGSTTGIVAGCVVFQSRCKFIVRLWQITARV